ncbi:Peroxisomal biogenesis factor 3 [Hypsizygus marmoreus]|uniref:Peroxisomal biogenesis factor 3 n=1 Tax=Hypsizygus marmoreus TaxID=39966 RepID=A0A369J250_HYPMA|nr:Peroxisomal biogenesis factor 3 [Hypsizygus marmoreus]
MLRSVKTFVSERRKGLGKAAAVVGGVYFVRGYIRDRLEEVKDRLEQERAARDNLKRRFKQTQEDVDFTVLALLQTLSEQIIDEMDVEGLTQELQHRSKARKQRRSVERPPSSLASSIDVVQEHETLSEAGSGVVSVASASYVEDAGSSSILSTSGLQSWVESSGSLSIGPTATNTESGDAEMNLSASLITTSSVENRASISVADSGPSDSALSSSILSDSSNSRTTAELWNEVKILTFTRTLTTLYSTTLLSLLTSIQLTLLARSKYIQSVLELERDERLQQRIEAQFSLSNMLLQSGRGLEDLLSGDMEALLDSGDDDEGLVIPPITEDVEARFLTMSWWILHVGWKDVGERVRRGVEEVFEGVSLKSRLAPIDLHRLVSDVRRRVEHEVTFEGNERRINFLSSLLPPTPETVQHVLAQGGFPSPSQSFPLPHDPLDFDGLSAASSSQLSQSQYLPPPPSVSLPNPHLHPHDLTQNQNSHSHSNTLAQHPTFIALLNETRSIISSSDFTYVLEICLDRATAVLFDGLERSVFVSSDVPPGEDVRIRLAGLLPGLTRWSKEAMNGVPCVLVDNIMAVKEVECLSAIIFAKFQEQVAR